MAQEIKETGHGGRCRTTRNINTRHAAALALAGWYLMSAPPRTWFGSQQPLGNWTVLDSFDTAAECRAKLDELHVHVAMSSAHRLPNGSLAFSPPLDPDAEKCIATDDPRLAK
jgi:hypothetical protein